MPIKIGSGIFNNGGTAKFGSTSLKEIKYGSATVWKASTNLLDSTNYDTWTSYIGNSSSTGGSSSASANGLYCSAGHWLSSGSDRRGYSKQMAGLTAVTKITIKYSNSKNDFNSAATWFMISKTPNYAGFYNGGDTTAIKTQAVGGSAHSDATLIWTWDTPQNMNDYYFISRVTTQGNTIKPNITLISVTVE